MLIILAGSPGTASRKRSLKPTDRSPWKMHGAAHGGPTGWFNHNRLSQRRRSRSHPGLQNRLSKSPVPHSPLTASSASSPTISTTIRASPRAKAAAPAAGAPDTLQEGALVQGVPSLSSVPSQPQQDSAQDIFDGPILPRTTPDEALGVQSNVPQQPPLSPKPDAPAGEGQAPSEATGTEVRSYLIFWEHKGSISHFRHRWRNHTMPMVEVPRYLPTTPHLSLHHWALHSLRSSEMHGTRTRAGT